MHDDYVALSYSDGIPLDPGVYNVVFTLTVDGSRENAVIREVLRVYSNLTSHLEVELTQMHFPTSLENIILGAWTNAPGGNVRAYLQNRNLQPAHFPLLNINGVGGPDGLPAASFNAFLDFFDTLTGPTLRPGNLVELRMLTDAALIGVRANASPVNHLNRNAARTYISGLVANGTLVTIPENSMWTNTAAAHVRTGVIVRVGPYDVPVTFAGKVYDYTVTFNTTGGTALSALRVYQGQVVLLPGGAGSRSGYNFVGWNTQANGGGRLHLGGSPFSVPGNVTLYATWSWVPPVPPPAPFPVTLNSGAGNGGSLPLGTVPGGTEIILPPLPDAFSNPGFGFSGWSDDGVRTLPAGAPFTVNGPTTLTAQWVSAVAVPVYHTVTLNPNSGIGAPIVMRVLSGSTIMLPAGGFTRQWHNLAGWSRIPVGVNGAFTYGTNTSLSNVTGNISLYAVWHRPMHTVTFNRNSETGTAPSAQQATHGSTITLPGGGGLSRENHIFIGWNTRSEGGAGTRLGSAPFLVTGNITLYAEWVPTVPVTHRVTFVPNGGEGTSSVSDPVPAGTSIMLPPESGFTKANYTFMGWSTLASGGALLLGNSPFTVTEPVTLHAQWRPTGEPSQPVFTLRFLPGGGTGDVFALTSVPSGTPITLPSGGFTRDGLWLLTGWARTPNATVADYALGADFTVRANTDLYAVWKVVPPTGSGIDIRFGSITSSVYGTLVVNPEVAGNVIQLGMTEASVAPTSRTFTITTDVTPDSGFAWFIGGVPVTGNTTNNIALSISSGRLISGGLNILIEPGVRSLNVEVLIGGVPYNLNIPFTVVP